ncbi:MAG: hypothetical protein A3A98_04225 [Candidatus Staskawiczbacteria bacterium RIFCSPLOWO2_01_FULL_40_39]|uniref:WbqC family protein n=1 Tax=Candidatus Staskawiczbacteria bacterium RIFCSPHIGHO2_01_FULL_39_25 TaxID=1802202 RepID=A0A1G2HQJ3_9BACT|nr:MAG: hypothetical protein A2730_03440 [Candidatus Staskawiczbacteria bacterium RIFCSPHIGHO2_01_FULL_39_25]OGZ73975.1 MAG: hypothetical protein A3A98_04225 [Candidatus Staskawiczbacteria bacterium RIFCSPLOWO2_01_FULL_40_39]OGZ75139.1 MAG: hypothetical protein A3I87_00460 [Candidatus Staskawiczbacteria bacterium RIFCSPLOWO2_02_FULL_39_8]
MIVTIHQPEYLPWLGFFDRIIKSDALVILDDVGYEKNGFINRNKIKKKNQAGWQYITVPVQGRSPHKKINEVLIDNTKHWQQNHLAIIKENYQKAPYFKEYFLFLEEALGKKWEKMSDLDIYLLRSVAGFLELKPAIAITSTMDVKGVKTERLVNICKSLGADTYLAGPGGKDYMDLELFKKEGIKVIFQEFKHPEYSQQFMEQGFLPGMSIIDLLFNHGPKSINIIRN